MQLAQKAMDMVRVCVCGVGGGGGGGAVPGESLSRNLLHSAVLGIVCSGAAVAGLERAASAGAGAGGMLSEQSSS